MLAMLDFFDYVIIAVIVSVFGAGAAAAFSTQDKAKLARLDAKVDLLLKHAGLELDPESLPEDVRDALEEEDEENSK